MNIGHFFLQIQVMRTLKTSSSSVQLCPFPLHAVPGCGRGRCSWVCGKGGGGGGVSNAHMFTECAGVVSRKVSLC